MVYTLHKSVYQSFQARPVVAYTIDELWQFDVLSKYDWLLHLKSQHGEESKVALTVSKDEKKTSHDTN